MAYLPQLARARPALLLFGVALLVRLAVVGAMDLRGPVLAANFDSSAAFEAAEMARGLLRDGDFTYGTAQGRPIPSAYQPPLYPLLLAGLFKVAGEGRGAFVFVQALQCIAGGIAAALACRLAATLLVWRYALLAGLLVSFWPTMAYLPVEVHPISLLVPVLLWAAICTIRVVESRGAMRHFAWLGVAFAIGLSMRSELIAALAFVGAVLLFQLRGRAVAGLASLAILAGLTLAPWLIRNKRSLGHYVLTTTSGLNLFRGNGPTATGGGFGWDGQLVWFTPEILADIRGLPWSPDNEIRVDRIYRDALAESLKEDRLRPLKLLPAKATFFWIADLTHPKARQPLVWAPSALILPAVLYGAWRAWPRRRLAWPLYFWIGFYFLIALALFALPRYRLNVEPMILILAAAGIGAFVERRRGGALFAGDEPADRASGV